MGAPQLLEARNAYQMQFGGDRNIGLKINEIASKLGLKVNEIEIDYWDTQKIPFSDLMKLLKPIFFENRSDNFLSFESLKFLQKVLLEAKNDFPYCRGGLVTTVITL